MLVYNIATAVCLGLMLALLLYVVISLAVKDRTDRIAFIRGFKKGKGFLAYVISVPLYMVGHIYEGNNFIMSLFSAFNKAINTVVLRYEVTSIALLMDANPFYAATVYICFVIVALNICLLSFSIFNQYIWDHWQIRRFKSSAKERLIIIGSNPASVNIYASAKEHVKLLVDEHISADDCDHYYARKVAYLSTSGAAGLARDVLALLKATTTRHIIVINTLDDERNLHICRQFYDYLHTLDDDTRKSIYNLMQIYVFGNTQYDNLYDDLVDHSFGIIRYVDKYQQVAIDFVDKYPLTRFMDERHIDYATSLLKPDIDLNVILIGFGDTNQKIFLTSVANNQFLTEKDGAIQLKQVNYHIFDKGDPRSNKNLNHNYYRYRNEVLAHIHPPEGVTLAQEEQLRESDFLPLPAEPATETYYSMSIFSPDFYRTIRKLVTRDTKDVNYVVIAFGTDLANLDLAQKLLDKKHEWGVENLIIFVKAKTWCKEYSFMQKENCYIIADENAIVYNLDHILNDTLYNMALLRNEIYDLEYLVKSTPTTEITPTLLAEVHERSEYNWYNKKSQMERESSIYCCLSLRSKLHLMGLDYRPKGEGQAPLDEEAYLAVYAAGDMPRFDPHVTTNGKHIVEYDLDFRDSRRKNMAVQEHYRWNSFMISKGTIPATLRQIREEVTPEGRHTKGKNYLLRRHGNLTTYEGLVLFRGIAAEINGSSELAEDVIKYDYQLLDDAYWFLNECGQEIVRRG